MGFCVIHLTIVVLPIYGKINKQTEYDYLVGVMVTTRGGEALKLDGEIGMSVMEVIRNHGIDELQALCGGCCSCATCHVHVNPDHAHLLEQATDFENELLDCSDHRSPTSRLSCQLKLHEGLDGLSVTIAPED